MTASKCEGPHLLIEGAAFTSALDIYTSKPVVLRGVSVRPEAHSPVALLTRPGAGPVYRAVVGIRRQRRSAVDAAVGAARPITRRSFAVTSLARPTAFRSADRTFGFSESLIETRAASAGDHNDAIQLLGAPTDIEIARNKILNRNPQTSCLS